VSVPLLELRNVKKWYSTKVKKNTFLMTKAHVRAVNDVSFKIYQGQTVGLVGESGCGKSTVGKMIVKLLKPTAGAILFRGKDIFSFSDNENRGLKKNMQFIFQDPYSSLDPRFTVERIIAEPMLHLELNKKDKRARVLNLMEDVGIRKEYLHRYPHEFSGGQRQRIGIARALSINPELIICDEPVSALDVSIQAQVINIMQDLQEKFGLTYLFISHDLSVVRHISDYVAVMYLGFIVELAKSSEIFVHPRHPYTKALLQSVPVPNPNIRTMTSLLEGEMPDNLQDISGCPFASRCKYRMDVCSTEMPPFTADDSGGIVACYLYD